MKAIGVIPARYASERFPGKVLADVYGKPLIQYVYEEALKAKSLEDLVIAADDQRVVKAVEAFGGRAVLTAKQHLSGTDRLTEIVNPIDAQIVVNIQADEPLIHSSMIDELVNCLSDDPQLVMASLVRRINDPQDLENPNVVKAVKDKNNFALYFSRAAIPCLAGSPHGEAVGRQACLRSSLPTQEAAVYYKHLGLYAYTKDFLFIFTNLPQGVLEKAECLEQLRALENGYKIKLIETNIDTIGVDTPEDLEKVKQALQKKL